MAQLVNNPPTMWETWVRSLDWEYPLEKGKAIHSSSPWSHKESDTTEQLSLSESSAGKESTCNEGDLGSIPVLGRFPGERNDYPLQYSCLIPGTEEPGWLQPMGLHGVGQD